MEGAQEQDIIGLYANIRRDPYYLEDRSPFVETALHRAASEGRTELALEILRLKPSLGKKLNLIGLSPLHLVLRNGHTTTVNRLVTRYPDLIRVKGRGGITPLHFVAETEHIKLLIKFLIECPTSIWDLTVKDESAVHIAVNNGNLRAFKVLRGWIFETGNSQVLRWRDAKGNTLLHLAALTNQPEFVKILIDKPFDRLINKNATNSEGKKALDILDPTTLDPMVRKVLQNDFDDSRHTSCNSWSSAEDYLSSSPWYMDLLPKLEAYIHLGLPADLQNAALVVLALVATATYLTALDTSGNRKSHMIVNTIGFSLSIGTCLILTVKDELLLSYICIYPLVLFLVSYGFLTHGVLDTGTIIGTLMSPMLLPIFLVLKWNCDLILMPSESRDGSYSMDRVKYLVFSSKYESARRQYENKASWLF